MRKVLLYSGGMDSYILRRLWRPDVLLFVDVGTKAAKIERARLSPDVRIMELPLAQFEEKNSALPLRNLFLMALASYHGNHILLGSTAEDVFLDGSKPFMKLVQKLLNIGWRAQLGMHGKSVKIEIGFKSLDKKQLLELLLIQSKDPKDVTLTQVRTESMSCYNPSPDGEECYECMSCLRKYVAMAAVGYQWEATVTEKIKLYLEMNNFKERLKDGGMIQPKWFKKVVYDIMPEWAE